MVGSYSKHQGQPYHRRESHSHHQKNHIQRRRTESLTRNYHSGSGDHSFHSTQHHRQSFCHNEDRNQKCNSQQHHHRYSRQRYGLDNDEWETFSYSSSSSRSSSCKRMPRLDSKHERRHSSRSPQRTNRSNLMFTPGCRGCQQQQAFMRRFCPPVERYQNIPTSHKMMKQTSNPQRQQQQQNFESQQNQENVLQAAEFAELKKSVYNIINSFTRSLRDHEWYSDFDHFRISENGRDGCKGKHQKESDWIQVY
ncbi:unnamed protein product [Hymenolepis diminuta]|uniref:Uncharacterized protein n=1 Tax=Hymenolepis diminuta TaxID=6216 RepID=A0A0R3SRR8_HYMDI|nr:unnamed protein product [Hymenolepis diminuta]VUZ52270.1 unnamed protein product [Hymenolepis diminuta]